jgi:asparagine synthase (glutamine-hydrolysing)
MFSGCGIAGLLRFDGHDRDAPGIGDVRRMTRALAHRGPNGEGVWDRPPVALGHRRLSIIDLGARAAQPMTRDHLTIVYNGELYNYRALRDELRPELGFSTTTDTEVVLRAWQRWGPDALARFNGMYAFAVWDDRERCLYLVRDRLGVKPLYYHRSAGFVAFASEVEALLRCEAIPRRPDLDALRHQLLCSSTLDVEPGRTLVQDVLSLPPATMMTVRPDGTARQHRYWQLPETPPGVEEDGAAELAELLRGSVTGMLVGDVPIGTFLSGGLDSSGITALAAGAQPITSVTVAYAADGSADPDSCQNEDLRFSRMLAGHYGERIDHRVFVQSGPLTLSDIDDVCDLATLGDDVRHVNILRNYRSIRDLGLRGVLNGQGADEIMGGYVGRPNFVRTILDVRDPSPDTITGLPGARQPAAVTPDVLSHRAEAHAKVLAFHAALPGTLLERAHRLLTHTQLERILRFEDYLSMRMSVEARVPFLDHRIVEWCFSRPFDSHISTGAREGKVQLRAALRPLLPPAVRAREKQVFPFPDQDSLRRTLVDLVERHAGELRSDDVVNYLFRVPDRGAAAALPVDTLWLLLSVWRWHSKLAS